MSKLVSNYIFNLCYQFLILILPLITIPYIARVLSPEGIGISSYSTSIVQGFAFFSLLGIHVYGNRQIASVKHKGRAEVSKQFWSIYFIQLCSSFFIMLVYIVFVLFFVDTNKLIFLIQTVALLAVLFDISWFYIGLEKLKKVVIRNAIIKLGSLFLIFIFVKNPQDVYIYILINVASNAIGQASMWFRIGDIIQSFSFRKIELRSHFKPIILIFLPLVFVQIYNTYNKILLGTYSSPLDVGFYDQALKIIQLLLTVVTSLGLVMLPRISSEFSKGNLDNIKGYINKILIFVLYVTFPMVIGLISISSNFVRWFLGPEFSEVENLIIIMSPIIIFIGCANVFGMQILIPTHQQNKYTTSVAIGACFSLILNLFLVKKLGALGTAISLLAAEGISAIIQAYFVKRFINYKVVFIYIIKYFLVSSIMGMLIFIIENITPITGLILTLIQLLVAIFFYLLIMLLVKDKITIDIFKMSRKYLALKKQSTSINKRR
jgi:O-antigen/teichoic acid export membrane protein